MTKRSVQRLATWMTQELDRIVMVPDWDVGLTEAQNFVAEAAQRIAILSSEERQDLRERLWRRSRPLRTRSAEDRWEALAGTIDGLLE